MSHQTPKLSLNSKLVLLGTSILVYSKTVLDTVRGLIFDKEQRSQPLRRLLALRFLRNRHFFSLEQSRATALSSGESIGKYCEELSLSHKTVQLENERTSTLHYINCEESTPGPLLLYFHGGGYALPLSKEGHLPFIFECAKSASANLVFLEYTLAPENPYPGQLCQAVDAIQRLLSQRPASEIILGGDSAGAHLALSLLAHIMDTSPYTPSVSLSGERFRGLCLLSPWVTWKYDAQSFDTNALTDYVSREQMLWFNTLWKPASEVWADPLSGSAEFWSQIPVEKILLTAGASEVFLDDINSMAAKLSSEKESKVDIVVCPQEVHVSCVVDTAVGHTGGRMSTAVVDWFSSI